MFKFDSSEKKKLLNELGEVSDYFKFVIINWYHAAHLMYRECEDFNYTYNIYLIIYYKFHEKPEDCRDHCQ